MSDLKPSPIFTSFPYLGTFLIISSMAVLSLSRLKLPMTWELLGQESKMLQRPKSLNS